MIVGTPDKGVILCVSAVHFLIFKIISLQNVSCEFSQKTDTF